MLRAGGVLGSALNLAVSTMGAGIVTLPSAFSDAGIIPATFVLVSVAVLTVLSIDYMVLCIDKLGVNSYERINRELLGKFNEEFGRFMVIIYNFGTGIGYLVVLGDLFEPIQPLISRSIPVLSTTKHTLLAFWFIIVLPLSCVPNISSLRTTSFLAIMSTIFIASLIVFRYFFPSAHDSESTSLGSKKIAWFRGSNPLLSLPIMMFSFDCQSLVFQIYSSLKVMNRSNMLRVSMLSLCVSSTVHFAVGLFGYIGRPTTVRENVLSNFDPNTDKLFAIGYFVYVIPVIVAFALIMFPTRDAIFLIWYGYNSTTCSAGKGYVTVGSEEYDEFQYTIPWRDHLIVSVSLSVGSIAMALVAPGIVSVIALLGGICSSTLCLTYPALYRIRLHHLGIVLCENRWERVAMYTMLALGIVGGILGTITAIMDYL